ncbi:unnamed protein product, partial [Didymodactylos carnosus]
NKVKWDLDVTIGAPAGRSSSPSRSGTVPATNRFIWLRSLSPSSDLCRTSIGQSVSVASRPRTPATSVTWMSLPHIDLHLGRPIRAGDIDRRHGKSRGNEKEETCGVDGLEMWQLGRISS